MERDLVKPGQETVDCIPLGMVTTSAFIIVKMRRCRLVNTFSCIIPFFGDKLYRLIGGMPGYIGENPCSSELACSRDG